jgi:hypothetical protein
MIKNAAGNKRIISISLKIIRLSIKVIPRLNKTIGLKEWWCFL